MYKGMPSFKSPIPAPGLKIGASSQGHPRRHQELLRRDLLLSVFSTARRSAAALSKLSGLSFGVDWVLKLASAEMISRCWTLTADSGAKGPQQVCLGMSLFMVPCTGTLKLSSSEAIRHQCQKSALVLDMRVQIVCCPMRIILSVDHLIIHIPAKPISTMTEPKVMFVMRSSERIIMSSENVRNWDPSKGFKLCRVTDWWRRQPCDRLESMSGDSTLKDCWTWGL
jgi:hypothetical protein